MLCTKCGHVNLDSARFCAQCGNALATPRPTTPPPSAQADKTSPSGKSGEAQARQHDPAAGAFTPGQTAHKREEAGRGASGSASSKAEPVSPAAEETQNKQILWLIIAIAVLAIAALANWLHSLYRDYWDVSLSLPPAYSEKPAVSSLPPRPPPTPPPAPVTAPLPDPAITPETSATAAPTSSAHRKKTARGVTETHLNEAQVKQLVARLQNGSAPASCDSAIAAVKQQAHVSQAQAAEIALRAYPTLCAPVAKAAPEPSPPRKPARTVDQVWQERVASECESGLGGVICGEKLRYKLCEGRWAANPPVGQKICHQPETSTSN